MAETTIKSIKMIALDVDGVLTDGLITYAALPGGEAELREFHVHDGQGVALAKRAGLLVSVITAKEARSVERRTKDLDIIEVLQGRRKKWSAMKELLERYRLRPDEVCYIGDDIADVPVMKRVGFPVAVANAVEEVKAAAKMVTRRAGGHGAVREVVEFILKRQGRWRDVLLSCYAELETED
jgi:3-deoxy-D-manno-octulosonate 8-phosphate phosphatase (KDO 8-P phosphatase)